MFVADVGKASFGEWQRTCTGISCRDGACRVLDGASPVSTGGEQASLAEQVAERLPHDLAADFGNRRGQRDVLRTNLDAVLRVAAFLDAAVAHERRQTLALQGLAGRMRVEEAHLRDRGRAYESGVLIELRTGFMQQQQEMQRESG